MKLVLTLLFAIGFALIFERRRVAAFFAQRRLQHWGGISPDLAERLFVMREALQEEQGQVDLTFQDVVDGERLAFLFSGASGRALLRISGPSRRYRVVAESRPGPMLLSASPPMDAAVEPGPNDPELWDYARAQEGWTPVADAATHHKGVALIEAFLRIWRNHLDPKVRDKRLGAWRKSVAKVDDIALQRLVSIVAREQPAAIDRGMQAIRADWRELEENWLLIPAQQADRDRAARGRILYGLGVAEVIATFDFKNYDADYIGPILLAGLPFADATIAALPEDGDFLEQIQSLDRACAAHGYRLVQLNTPDDDFTMAVIEGSRLDELQDTLARLGLGKAIPADRIDF